MLHYLFAWAVQLLSTVLGLMMGAAPAIVSILIVIRNQYKHINYANYRHLMAATLSIIGALVGYSFAIVGNQSYSSQSLGNIAYLFAVLLAFAAWGIGYLLGLCTDKTFGKSKPAAPWIKYLLLILIIILGFGLVRHVVPSVDVEIVRTTENLRALTYLAMRVSSDDLHGVGVASRIASRWGAPSGALMHLSKHGNNAIRLQVANNENTSIETLLTLSTDCNERVRLQVQKRISSASVTTPSVNCPDHSPPVTDTPYR